MPQMQKPPENTAAILLAAGSATRMLGSVEDKTLARLAGVPVVCYSVDAFVKWARAKTIAVVYRDSEQCEKLKLLIDERAKGFRVIYVKGGKERQDSVRNALAALPKAVEQVFIHDCARPLVRSQWLEAMSLALEENKAVTLARPVTDTIKSAEEPVAHPAPGAAHTCRWIDLDRKRLWAVETPQAFALDLLREAYEYAAKSNATLTDDTAAIALLGQEVTHIFPDGPNWKLTRPEDLFMIEAYIKLKSI